jgi:hypothetical protein
MDKNQEKDKRENKIGKKRKAIKKTLYLKN